MICYLLTFFFFFQAEDGIRDIGVTGVQTCALPILRYLSMRCLPMRCLILRCLPMRCLPMRCLTLRCLPMRCLILRCLRSEERRVGKECRSMLTACGLKESRMNQDGIRMSVTDVTTE